MKILIINGPNLNLLGKRETSIYGNQSFELYLKELIDKLKPSYDKLHIDYYQNNHEGNIIDQIQKADGEYDGIILNAGGFTHTSIAIADAISAVGVAVIEVHISNIYAREEFRRKSLISHACAGIIAGFGLEGYSLAVQHFINLTK
ncbi:MAG: type II 3-dehydroquinate dehydratase [Candidatus Cyclobacteriaceae bacterium M2_1C_046]